MSHARLMFAAAVMLFVAATARPEDVYVLQGSAVGPVAGTCTVYLWTGDILLFNRGTTMATVRLLDTSNGPTDPSHQSEIVLAPGQATSWRKEDAHWKALAGVPIWVTHIDAPDTVTVESRIEIGLEYSCPIGSPPPGSGINGKLSFPVFHALNPPNIPKVHLGTDLASVDSRNNVAVFNAGDAPAIARIEVRLVCDGSLVDERTIEVPPDSVVQTAGLRTKGECAANPAFAYMTYVSVVVDQPSLSWVSSLANANDLKVVYGVTSSSP